MNTDKKLERSNLQAFCRTCLQRLESATATAPKYSIRETPYLMKLLMLCTAININEEADDVYPQLLCSKCYNTLQEFQLFREMALQSNEMLKELVESEDGEFITSQACTTLRKKFTIDAKPEMPTEEISIDAFKAEEPEMTTSFCIYDVNEADDSQSISAVDESTELDGSNGGDTMSEKASTSASAMKRKRKAESNDTEMQTQKSISDINMSRLNRSNSDDILAILNEEEDFSLSKSASETEDNQIGDDVQSEDENYYVTEEVPEANPQSDSVLALGSVDSGRIYRVRGNTLRGKNGHIWSTHKGKLSHRTPAMNIVRTSRGPAETCKNIFEPVQIFNLFITDKILSEIVKWTNVEMISKRRMVGKVTANYRDTTDIEIRALIGILTLTAVMKDNNLSTDELFDTTFAGTRYVSVMSKDRFEFLVRCLRMDDKTLRPTLKANDAFVPARNIWELFMQQCRNNYVPGSEVTIDEQLIGFQGKCPFRIYMSNKSAKYGIKFPMMCDAISKYMIDADPYAGKSTNTEGVPLSEFYVKKLSKTIHGSNRNITCDNWFTSVPLAKNLIQQPYKLTLVGTIRSTKPEIPEQLKNSRFRPVGSSMFCFDGPLTLVSYKPKPAKMVYLLSSCDSVIDNSSGKSDMIHFYNQTKGAVDSFDQMCSSMSCSRKTTRWPMAVFYAILNMAFVNSAIIYGHNMIKNNKKPLNRREFMKKLSSDLVTPWMEMRLDVLSLKRYLRVNISQILAKPLDSGNELELREAEVKKRKYCAFCSYKKRRMSTLVCYKCNKSICRQHNVDACVDCCFDYN